MRRRILLIPACLLIWLMLSLGMYVGWIHGSDHRDFYPRWAGARLAVLEHRDLYSAETTRQMQVMLYGGPIPAGRDQQAFAYPAQLVVILFPFWLIPNVEIATALWEGLSVFLLAGSVYVLGRKGQPRLPGWAWVGLVLWYYPVLMVFQGQLTGLVLLALAAGYSLFEGRKDLAAGLVLSLGVIKPELVLVPYLFFAWMALRGRRWRFAAAFLGGQMGLFLLSFLVAGWWVPGWLDALRRYAAYAQTSLALRTAWGLHPLALILLLCGLAWAVFRIRRQSEALFAASIPLGMLVLPQTLIYGLSMLLAPLALSWRGRGRWVVALIWVTGWAMLFLPSSLWRWQDLLLPLLTLGGVVVAFGGGADQPAS